MRLTAGGLSMQCRLVKKGGGEFPIHRLPSLVVLSDHSYCFFTCVSRKLLTRPPSNTFNRDVRDVALIPRRPAGGSCPVAPPLSHGYGW
jgi:hypothetical protein